MTRFLSDLIGGNQAELQKIIKDFEPLTGHAGVDIRLSDQLKRLLRDASAQLGLDATDTTSKELYYALLSKAMYDDAQFARRLGVAQKGSEVAAADAVHKALKKITASEMLFVPKRTALKKILDKRPPKAALKLLHFRSFASMYKRCPMTLILAAADMTQSKKWKEAFHADLAKLGFSDFEERPAEFVTAPARRWAAVNKKLISSTGVSVFASRSAGGIVLVPAEQKCRPGQTLLFAVAGLRVFNRLKEATSLTRRALVDTKLGTSFGDIASGRHSSADVTLRSVKIGWHHQHRAIGRHADILQIFEPHISSEHMSVHDPANTLNRRIGGLKFWLNTKLLGHVDGSSVVSGNLYDVLLNCVYQRPFGKHTSIALSRALRNELVDSYFAHDQIRQSLKDKLTFDPASHEPLVVELEQNDFV